jgi:signal transduction histidine kinase
VSVRCTDGPSGVSLAFADNGRGIVPDDLARIFDPFYTTKPDGLGLGLYVTRNIVKEHGGHIEVVSRVGEGTTFEVWLPA